MHDKLIPNDHFLKIIFYVKVPRLEPVNLFVSLFVRPSVRLLRKLSVVYNYAISKYLFFKLYKMLMITQRSRPHTTEFCLFCTWILLNFIFLQSISECSMGVQLNTHRAIYKMFLGPRRGRCVSEIGAFVQFFVCNVSATFRLNKHT